MSDLDFIKKLDKKLHYQTDAEYCGHPYKHDSFHIIETKGKPDKDVKMSLLEYDKFVMILEKGDFIITPCSPGFGFIAGFSVHTYVKDVYIPQFDEDDYDAKKEVRLTYTERVLVFTKNQLPASITYKDLEKIVKSENNLNLLKFYGFDEVRDESYYDY